MQQSRRTAIVISYVSLIASSILFLLINPQIIKMIGQSEHGLYTIVNSTIAYFTIFDFGMGNAIIRYSTKLRVQNEKDKEWQLYGTFLLIYIGIGILTLIGGIILSLNADVMYKSSLTADQSSRIIILMLIATFNVAVHFPLSLFKSVINAYERYTFLKTLDLIYKVLNPLMMLGVLFLNQNVLWLILVTAIFSTVLCIVRFVYCIRELKINISFRLIEKKLLKEIVIYSAFIFIAMIADKLFWSTDVIILGIMCDSTSNVSIYSYGFTFVSMFISFTSVISQMYLPRFTRLTMQEKSEMTVSNEFIRISRLQFFFSAYIYIGFILVGRQLIEVLVGVNYTNSYFVALCIMTGLLLGLSQNVGIVVLQARNMHKFRSIVQFGVAVANILLTIVLITRLDEIGAAVATMTTKIGGVFIIMSIYYMKRAKLDVIKLWRSLSKSILFYIIIVFIFTLIMNKVMIVINPYLSIVIVASIFSIVYWLLTYNVCMNKNEKNQLNELFKLLKRRVFA